MSQHQKRGWLMVVPKQKEVPETQSERTPLAGFLQALRLRDVEQQHYDARRGVTWTRALLEPCFVHGILICVQSFAGKLNLPAAGPRNLTHAAARLDPLVNAGLVLAYDSMSEAADAFTEHMEKDIETALRHTPTLRAAPVSTLCMKPSAQFIAALVRKAVQMRDQVAVIAPEVTKEQSWELGETTRERARVSFAARLSTMLDPTAAAKKRTLTESEWRAEIATCLEVAPSLTESLERLVGVIDGMEQARAAFSYPAIEGWSDDASLAHAWILTQLIRTGLLSGTSQNPRPIKYRAHLLAREYVRVMKKLEQTNVARETFNHRDASIRFRSLMLKLTGESLNDDDRERIILFADRLARQRFPSLPRKITPKSKTGAFIEWPRSQ